MRAHNHTVNLVIVLVIKYEMAGSSLWYTTAEVSRQVSGTMLADRGGHTICKNKFVLSRQCLELIVHSE